jgi:hypothetical protein
MQVLQLAAEGQDLAPRRKQETMNDKTSALL